VVIDTCNKRVRKLNDTILDLTTTNILLKYKLEGYERALTNEKKKRQRGKALDFKLTAPEDGRATFYSPNKIRQARQLQKEEEEAKQAATATKAEEKLQRQLQKEEKRRLIN